MPECRLEFLDPQPEDSVLTAIYSDSYFLGERSAEDAARRSQMKGATGRLYVDALSRVVRPQDTDLLEIGCGHGELLLEARMRGFRCFRAGGSTCRAGSKPLFGAGGAGWRPG